MEYNGWTNYATWRVNIEYFDGWDSEEYPLTPESAEEIVTEHLREQCSEGTCLDYAEAFIAHANWYEIAKAHGFESEDYDE